MNINRERKTIDEALDNYRAQLDTIPDDVFTETPPDGGWSYAEVYSHIMQATLASLVALERCTQRVGDANTKGINLTGRFVLLFERFPPVKIKVPRKVDEKFPATKISKEEARNLIVKCRTRINDMMLHIKEAAPGARTKHPRLGMLNAGQWLKFTRIHLEHHLKQLDRIRKKTSH